MSAKELNETRKRSVISIPVPGKNTAQVPFRRVRNSYYETDLLDSHYFPTGIHGYLVYTGKCFILVAFFNNICSHTMIAGVDAKNVKTNWKKNVKSDIS